MSIKINRDMCCLQVSQLGKVVESPLVDVNETPRVLDWAVTQILAWQITNKRHFTMTQSLSEKILFR